MPAFEVPIIDIGKLELFAVSCLSPLSLCRALPLCRTGTPDRTCMCVCLFGWHVLSSSSDPYSSVMASAILSCRCSNPSARGTVRGTYSAILRHDPQQTPIVNT